ncbi:YbjQ family protein [Cognatiyoonia sp.]|uniref:YbjQ family protein n=1 Tax=Cognatiyoonia sp. TaxID=2211652 RepID=UPI003F6A1831
MMITTTDTVAHMEITQTIGKVSGAPVRSKHINTDIVASLRNLVGGEQTGYSSLLADAREQALDRMIEQTETLGADAIAGFRMETSSIMDVA